MGSTTERWRSYVNQAKGTAADERAQAQTTASEQQRRFGEMYLGSEGQAAGADAYDPSVIPFTQRYSFDEATISSLGGSQWGPDNIMQRGLWDDGQGYFAAHQAGEAGAGVQGYAQYTQERANTMLDDAQKAAEAGDMEKANALKAEAQALVSGSTPARTGPESASFTGAFYLKDNPDYVAKAQLSGPMAQTAGTIVKEGREILDRNSETSKAFRSSLTRGANLKLAAGMRGTQRAMRQMGAAGGGAYNPGQAAAQGASLVRDMSAQLAQVEAAAGQAYEQYRTQAAQNSVDFGMSFLDRQAGVRDEFNTMNNQLLMHQSDIMMQAAQLSMQFSQLADQRAQASKSRTDAFIGLGVGAITSLAGAAFGKKASSGTT